MSRVELNALDVRAENGSAVLALLVLALLATLMTSTHALSTIETSITDNQYRKTQAFYLAEAGFGHATAALDSSNSTPDTLLAGRDGATGTADDGRVLGNKPIPLGDGSYEVRLIDNDDGDGDPFSDADGRVVLVVTGNARDAVSEIRATLAFGGGGGSSFPPYLFANKLTTSNVTRFLSPDASVHSNVGFEMKEAEFWGTVSSSGEIDVDDDTILEGQELDDDAFDAYIDEHSFVPKADVPEVDPEDYRHLADFVMSSDGRIVDGDGSLVYDASDGSTWNGWKWQGSRWTMSNVTPEIHNPGAYFVEGNLETSSSNGTMENPLDMTLITTGNLKFTGKMFARSHAEDLLIVAGTDLEFTGATDAFQTVGHILVHEQMKASGKFKLLGGIIVEDAEDLDGKIKRSSDGTKWSAVATLDYNDTLTPLPGTSSGTGFAAVDWYRH